MVSLSSMRRRLCRRRNGVVALVAMVSLPLPMHRRLAVVDNDGNGATGDNDDDVDNDGATGDDDDQDGATDNKVDDDDVDGAMNDDINDECDGTTGDNDDDGDNATDDDVNNDGNGATDDDVNDDDGNRTTDGDCMTDGDRTTDKDVDNNGYGAMDDDIDDDCDGATDSCHCLDACGGCATKGDARRRHATTGAATTSGQTRCTREARRQGTRGDKVSIGRDCALRGRGRVERMTGRGIDLPTRNGSP